MWIRLCSLSLICFFLFACTPELPDRVDVQVVTAVPTLNMNDGAALCEAVTTHWGRDWVTVIRALEGLNDLNVVCADGLTINGRLYAAHLAYGTLLERNGRQDEAIIAYRAALVYNPQGEQAARRLRAFNVLTPAPPTRCEPGLVAAASRDLSDYTPREGEFVRVAGQQLFIDDAPYIVYGVNYYPRNTPFQRFLTETPLNVVEAELDIIARAGLNTLRIFVRYDEMFICPGNGAVPVADVVNRLDGIIHAAADRGFRLIVVLHHEPDLVIHPLYETPDYILEQTRFIVERYRDEPTIIAWDLRDSGDADYRSGEFSREQVLLWLFNMAAYVRQIDSSHLITAGWREDAEATAPAVDFVSFQYYEDIEPFRQRVAVMRSQTTRPILLTAVGYSTHTMDETAQRNLLFQILEATEVNGLVGWNVWMAFDYPLSVTCVEPDCPAPDAAINHYGLWNTSYFPKLALDAVMRFTGADG